jgi:hypothetical protein
VLHSVDTTCCGALPTNSNFISATALRLSATPRANNQCHPMGTGRRSSDWELLSGQEILGKLRILNSASMTNGHRHDVGRPEIGMSRRLVGGDRGERTGGSMGPQDYAMLQFGGFAGRFRRCPFDIVWDHLAQRSVRRPGRAPMQAYATIRNTPPVESRPSGRFLIVALLRDAKFFA